MPILKLTATRQRQILMVVVGMIVFTLWINGLILPQLNRWKERGAMIQQLESKVTSARQKLIQLPRIELEIGRLSAMYKMSIIRPLEEQLPQLLEIIAQTAYAKKVQILAVKPLREDLSKLSVGSSGYIELPVEVNAVSGYYELIEFLHSLETSEILVRIKTLEIKSDPKNTTHHQATIFFDAYLVPVEGVSS